MQRVKEPKLRDQPYSGVPSNSSAATAWSQTQPRRYRDGMAEISSGLCVTMVHLASQLSPPLEVAITFSREALNSFRRVVFVQAMPDPQKLEVPLLRSGFSKRGGSSTIWESADGTMAIVALRNHEVVGLLNSMRGCDLEKRHGHTIIEDQLILLETSGFSMEALEKISAISNSFIAVADLNMTDVIESYQWIKSAQLVNPDLLGEVVLNNPLGLPEGDLFKKELEEIAHHHLKGLFSVYPVQWQLETRALKWGDQKPSIFAQRGQTQLGGCSFERSGECQRFFEGLNELAERR